MNNNSKFWTDADVGLLILRVAFFGTFILHGVHKVMYGIEEGVQILVDGGLPGQLMYLVYVSEILAPLLIVLGISTRLSILTVVMTMIAIFYVLPIPIGLGIHGDLTVEVHVFFTLVPLALFFTGPGRFRVVRNSSGNWLLD